MALRYLYDTIRRRGEEMSLNEQLDEYAKQMTTKGVYRVSSVLFVYMLLCAGLTFNLYSLFYWVNFMTTKADTGQEFPMRLIYIANTALVFCLVFGTLMYRYRRRHLALLKRIKRHLQPDLLVEYTYEELVEKRNELLKREDKWKQKLDAGLIAAILSLEMATIDSSNIYNYIVGFIIVPLLGFIIFGLYVDRYYEGLFSNTNVICQICLLTSAIQSHDMQQKRSDQPYLEKKLIALEIENQKLKEQLGDVHDQRG